MNERHFIFLAGNLSDGFRAFGPYASAAEAADAHEYEEGWIMGLNTVQTTA